MTALYHFWMTGLCIAWEWDSYCKLIVLEHSLNNYNFDAVLFKMSRFLLGQGFLFWIMCGGISSNFCTFIKKLSINSCYLFYENTNLPTLNPWQESRVFWWSKSMISNLTLFLFIKVGIVYKFIIGKGIIWAISWTVITA